jgi:hypothetical protein
MKDKELTPKEERFCYEYVLYLNATKAAINAGYRLSSKKKRCADRPCTYGEFGAVRGGPASKSKGRQPLRNASLFPFVQKQRKHLH